MKHVKHTVYILALLLASAFGAIRAQDEGSQTMKGTEAPAFQTSTENEKCFVFAEYVVKVVVNEDEGEDLTVYRRPAGEDGETACDADARAILKVADTDNNSFFGTSGKFMFVDSGTSAESRGLAIYDLAARKLVANRSYSGEPMLVQGRFVLFDSPSDKTGVLRTCKEAAKWKREGGGVRWVQGRRLDLQTHKETSVGSLRCAYME